jgi:hypothetical protein
MVGMCHRQRASTTGRAGRGCTAAIEELRLPQWLIPALQRQWATPCMSDHVAPEPMASSLRHLSRIGPALRRRWRDPISATVRVEGRFDDGPRLPYQLLEYARQSARFLRRWPSRQRRAAFSAR